MNFLNYQRPQNFLKPSNTGNFDTPYKGVRFEGSDESELDTEPESESEGNQGFDLRRLLSQPSPALDKYRQHLEEVPKESDYEAGKLQKVLAGIAGFSTMDPIKGYQTTKGLIDAPYNSAVTKYREKGQNLGELADIEMKDTAGKIKLASNITQEERARTKDTAQLTRWSVLNAKDKASMEEGKTIVVKNEITGEDELRDKLSGKVIKSLGKLRESATEKRDNDFGMFRKRSGVTLGNQRSIESTRQTNRVANIHTSAEETRTTQKAAADRRAKIAADTALSINQDKIAYDMAKKQFLADNPASRSFWDSYGNPTGEAEENDDYVAAVTDIRRRYNEIKKNKQSGSPINSPSNSKVAVTRADVIAEIKKNFPDRPDLLTNNKYIDDNLSTANAH